MGGAMSKITTPLQALEEIRAVCWSEARRENVTSATFEMLRRQVAELAMDGMRSAAEPAGLTPVQARADELLEGLQIAMASLKGLRALPEDEAARLSALLDELDPPKPPTLEEAIEVVRQLAKSAGTEKQYDALAAARGLLKRVPN